MLVLIDGDALPVTSHPSFKSQSLMLRYQFTDDLLEKGYEGGKAAAEKLLDASFSIARRLLPKTRFTTV